MNKHAASARDNGSTISMSQGETLTIVLPYKETGPDQTYWTFGETFGHNTSLNLESIAAIAGKRVMEFVATNLGSVEIALQQFHTVALQTPSNRTATFKLNVVVL
jgi:hypothetical protein